MLSAPRGDYSAAPALPPASPPAAPAPTYFPTKFYTIPVHVTYTKPLVTGHLQHSQDTYGQYAFTYSSSDGQSKNENRNTDGSISGQFSYMSPEGKPVTLSYIADKDGFRAVGNHLPVAPKVPEMPADLAQAYKESNDRLEKAYEEARLRGDNDDGSYKAEQDLPKPKVPITYHTYKTPIHTIPIVQTKYETVKIPVKTIYVAQPPAIPVHEPVKYQSTSYSTEIGGTPVVPVSPPAPAAPELPKKSAYTFTGGY